MKRFGIVVYIILILIVFYSSAAYAGYERFSLEGGLVYTNTGGNYKFGPSVGTKISIPFPLAGEQALRARLTYIYGDSRGIKQLLVMIDGVQSFRVNEFMRIYGGIGMNLSFPRDDNANTQLKTGFGGQIYGGGEFFFTDHLAMYVEAGGIMVQTVDNIGTVGLANMGRTIRPWITIGGRLSAGGGKPKLIIDHPTANVPYIKLDNDLLTSTTHTKVIIRGSIGTDVNKVLVNGQAALVKKTAGLFYIKMDVIPGENTFTIEAYDEKGQVNKIKHVVYRETNPPKITFQPPIPTVTRRGIITLRGKAFSIKTLQINDENILIKPNGLFYHRLQLLPGQNTITIKTTDYNGKEIIIKKYVLRK